MALFGCAGQWCLRFLVWVICHHFYWMVYIVYNYIGVYVFNYAFIPGAVAVVWVFQAIIFVGVLLLLLKAQKSELKLEDVACLVGYANIDYLIAIILSFYPSEIW
jgi:hypothetical protein